MKAWKLSLAIAVMIVLVALSVGAQSSGTVMEKASGTVRIWTFLDPNNPGTDPRSNSFAKIIANFQKKYPDVKVNVEPQQFDLLTSKFLASAVTGSGPDIIWILNTDIPLIVQSGYLAALEDTALKGWSAKDMEDISGKIFETYAVNGKHYIKDIGIAPYMIVYRKDLFDAKSIKLPFKTWDDLIAAAKQLNGTDPKTGMQVYGLGFPLSPTQPDPSILHSYIANLMNGQIFNPNGTAGWNGPAGIAALQFVKDLIFTHKIAPESILNTNNNDLVTQFVAGKFAMISAASLRITSIRGQVSVCKPLDIQMTPYPETNGKPTPSCLSGWTFGINKYSKNIAAASLFYAWMISPESDKIWCEEAGQNPSRQSTITNDPAFFNDPKNAYIITAKTALATNAYAPVNPRGFAITGWSTDITQSTTDYFIKGRTAQAALDASAEAFNKRNVK